MFARLRLYLGHVEFQTPRAEPSPFTRLPDEPMAAFRLEQKVNRLDEQLAEARRAGDQAVVDALLDQRNALRPARDQPAVPITPGRP